MTPRVHVYCDWWNVRYRFRLAIALGRFRTGAVLGDVAFGGVPHVPRSTAHVIIITVFAVCIDAPPEGASATRAIADEEVV